MSETESTPSIRLPDPSKLIVSDGVFSMDGDIAPIPEIAKLAKAHDALVMIDDAHGIGVLGANGRGSVEHLGVEEDKVIENASFIDDLGADSLDTVELVMAFEEEFGIEIPDDAAETIQTFGDAVKFISEAA